MTAFSSDWEACRMSVGTNRTNRAGLTMSVDRGRQEVTFQGRGDRFYPVRKSAFTQPLKVAPRPPAPTVRVCQRKITFVLGFQSRWANSVARRLDKPTSKLNARIS
jgi:hypothetical protein